MLHLVSGLDPSASRHRGDWSAVIAGLETGGFLTVGERSWAGTVGFVDRAGVLFPQDAVGLKRTLRHDWIGIIDSLPRMPANVSQARAAPRAHGARPR